MAEAFIDDSDTDLLALLEVPLLYEVDFPIQRDFDLVIGCSQQIQKERLMGIRRISGEQAEKILSSQLPIQVKVDKADFVAWNDGMIETFEGQIQMISETILSNTKGV